MNLYPNLQYNSEDDNEDVPTNCAILQKKLCSKGKHYLILDEEIGVICKFCSYVKLEMKYVMPEFVSHFHSVNDVHVISHFCWYDAVYNIKYFCLYATA